MTLQFVTGKSNVNHREKLISMAREWLDKDEKNLVFFLVPNSIKFEQEISLLKEFGKQNETQDTISAIRFQVFSFHRLAWYFMQDSTQLTKQSVSEAGAKMLMRKSLLQVEPLLKVYRGQINKSGFIEKAIKVYDEFRLGNLNGELIENLLAEFAEKNQRTKMKLSELTTIFQKYEENLVYYERQNVDLLLDLATYLGDLDLSHAQFILSGYSRLSLSEQALVKQLIKKAGEMKVDLVLDQVKLDDALTKEDLFFETKSIYQQCYQYARENNIPVLFDATDLVETKQRADLKQATEYWLQSSSFQPASRLKHFSAQEYENLCVSKAKSAQVEVEFIAKEIHRLVSEEGYRYRDIQVLTRDINHYVQLIEPIFALNDIPVISGKDEKMKNHPLVDFIQSLFNIDQKGYQYEDLFRFLRTELLIPKASTNEVEQVDLFSEIAEETFVERRKAFRQQLDITENIVLRYGFTKRDWLSDEDWRFTNYHFDEDGQGTYEQNDDERISNIIRRFVRDSLLP